MPCVLRRLRVEMRYNEYNIAKMDRYTKKSLRIDVPKASDRF